MYGDNGEVRIDCYTFIDYKVQEAKKEEFVLSVTLAPVLKM